MFKRYWNSNTLFGLVALLIVGLIGYSLWDIGLYVGKQATQADYRSEQTQTKANEQIAAQCAPLPAGAAQLNCIAAVLRAERDKERAEQDLRAQQDMAQWAEKLIWFSALEIVLGGLGVLYVVRTFNQTQKIGVAQVRAYLTCIGGDYTITDDICMINIHVSNVGQSPAFKCQTLGRLNLRKMTELEGPPEAVRVGPALGWVGNVVSGIPGIGTMFFDEEKWPELQLEKMFEFPTVLLVTCNLEWEDVFDEKQSVQFAMLQDTRERGHDILGRRQLTCKLKIMRVDNILEYGHIE